MSQYRGESIKMVFMNCFTRQIPFLISELHECYLVGDKINLKPYRIIEWFEGTLKLIQFQPLQASAENLHLTKLF